MAYRVRITDAALVDAEEYVRFIRDTNREPEAAERWFRDLVSAIFSLEDFPLRCPQIPEAGEFGCEIRHFIFHSHRIIFQVNEASKSVDVLRVYHGSRRTIGPQDLEF